mmetsp:Transcript_19312/g.74166  ORF Transcript_19312/g.74166 Transcript_19312/m.74166 type:complete len:114 (+) Transcript_19312:48-389(+)
MERKMMTFMIAQGIIFVCCIPLVFAHWVGVILAIVGVCSVVFGLMGYICVHKMIMMIYLIICCIVPLLAAGAILYYVLEASEVLDYWPIPFCIIYVCGYIAAAIGGFLYYREI